TVRSRRANAAIKKELCGLQATVSAGVEKRGFDLSWIGFAPGHAALIEVGRRQAKPTHHGAALKIQGRTETGKEPGRGGLSVRETAVNDGMFVAGPRWVLQSRTPIEQRLGEINLYASFLRGRA